MNSHVIARKNDTGEYVEIVSDQLLIATGRIPNSDTLDLAKSRVKTNQQGFIGVDEKLETNIKGNFCTWRCSWKVPISAQCKLGSPIYIQ